MEKKFKVLPPMMPNFIKIEMENEMENGWVSVRNLTQEEAEQFGELMKQTFINHWKERNEKTY